MSQQAARPASPSPWIRDHADLVPPTGRVLDVAAGAGRHAVFFADRGHPVVAVDLLTTDLPRRADVTVVTADLEMDRWPLHDETFAAVVVVNYLHRPLFPHLLAAVAPGGVLLYDTFMVGQERIGRPRNPNHLLRPGELATTVVPDLRVVDVREGPVEGDRPSVRQSIAAVRDEN